MIALQALELAKQIVAPGGLEKLNADLADPDALRAHLADRSWLHPSVTADDVVELREFQVGLRPVFEASEAGEVSAVVRASRRKRENSGGDPAPLVASSRIRRPPAARRSAPASAGTRFRGPAASRG